jgi:hypothetical protein
MLIIRGLEVTQAIQYYRSAEHLTDPGEQLPDNAVTLIANKSAWVASISKVTAARRSQT